jgi:beta-phosphoglucomutase
MASEGVALTYPQFRATFGWRNDAILGQWLGERADAALIDRIGDAKEETYRRLVREGGIEPLEGAADWVHRLHGEGWLQAIASSAPRLNIEVVMEAMGLAGLFEASASAEDVERGKPDPQVFLLAASRLGVPPAGAIVVEDAGAGIEAARRAGMRSIAVVRDGGTLPADLVVRSLKDLPADAFAALLDGQPGTALR